MRNVRVRRAVQALRKVLVGVGGQDALGPDGYAVTLESNLLYPGNVSDNPAGGPDKDTLIYSVLLIDPRQ